MDLFAACASRQWQIVPDFVNIGKNHLPRYRDFSIFEMVVICHFGFLIVQNVNDQIELNFVKISEVI